MFAQSHQKKLKNKLLQEYAIHLDVQAGRQAIYEISMENDYLTPLGKIKKKQRLFASLLREFTDPISNWTIGVEYCWEKVQFSTISDNNKGEIVDWNFANGLKFNYFRSFEESLFDLRKQKKHVGPLAETNLYEDLVSTPSVNLLYMLTWDVIAFEQICTEIVNHQRSLRKFEDVVEIELLNNLRVPLHFKGVENKNSFFKNGKFWVKFIGFSGFSNRCVMIFNFHSVGTLQVESQHRRTGSKQSGESFYFGSIYIDVENGEYLFGDMIEIITASIVNKAGKIVPQNKRRMVKIEKKKRSTSQ